MAGGVTKELSGGERDTTNNRMELMAVIEGLSALKRPCTVHIDIDERAEKARDFPFPVKLFHIPPNFRDIFLRKILVGVQKNNPPQPGRIRNVVISNVTARNAWFASSITAIPGSYVENVILENIIVTMKGINNPALVEKTVDEKINAYPDAHMWGDLPASTFYVRHAKNLSLGNVKCFLDAEDIRPLCIFDDVKDLSVSGFVSDERVAGNAAFRFIGVENAFFTSVFLKGSPKFWYDLRGEGNTNIHLSDTEPTKVRSEKSCSVVQQTSFILL